MTSFNL